MMMRKLSLILALLAAAPAPVKLSPADDAAVRAAVRAIYRPYATKDAATTPAAWDYPIYAQATNALIASWKKATANPDEVTAMSDFDWLCQCQDYDYKTAKITGITTRSIRGGAEANVLFTPGWKEKSQLRLMMVKEKGRWMISDMVFENDRTPLTSLLRQAIAEAKK
jgi:Protein of unknown function (DUF3828)